MKRFSAILGAAILLAACAPSGTGAPITAPTNTRDPDISAQITPPETSVETHSSFSCPHSEMREVFFTSSAQPDRLLLDIVGDDCNAARLVMTLTSDDGDIVYENEARALSYVYDLEGPEGVEYLLDVLTRSDLFSEEDVKSGAALPPYDDLSDRDGFSDIHEAMYTYAREQNRPLFCHKGGKTYSRCFIYAGDQAVQIFVSGS